MTSVRPVKTLLAGAACMAMLVLSAIALPSSADAYTHRWYCGPELMTSGARCFDNSGSAYNPWVEVQNNMWDGRTHPEVCAKGRTSDGNTRDGGSSGCSYWSNYRKSCFGYELPQTQAYIYYIRNDSLAYSVDGRAETPATRTC
jgi:hypothetical protein